MTRYVRVALALAAVVALAGAASANEAEDMCWKKSYTRGVGSVPTDCPAGTEKDAGLCYSTCRSGFDGVGPVCWSDCPSGYRNDGAFCAKPAPYGRGAGYPWKFGDALNDDGMRSRCEADHGKGKCEKNGAVFYPKCKAGYNAVGCCTCSPVCPSGMTDIGVSCAKESYTRGVGKVPSCGPGLEEDAGLCYDPCAKTYDEVGPVCWSTCPPEYPVACGAGCAVSQSACAAAVTDMTVNTLSAFASCASLIAGGPGVTAAVKTAATAGAKAAGKTAATGGFRAGLSLARQGGKTYAKEFAKTFIKSYAKGQLDPRNATHTVFKVVGTGAKQGTSLAAANQASREAGSMKADNVFDYEMLLALDPTGIGSMINSFAKYPSCTIDDLTASAQDVDFGDEPAKGTAVRKVTLQVQNTTTFEEITATPLVGCGISAEADCMGKTLTPGQTCNVTVRVTGKGKVIGEVRVYTTAYDIIPFTIGVTANSTAAAECAMSPDAVESVGISSIQGVWAVDGNQGSKMVVSSDGSATTPAGAAKVAVTDPLRRIYTFQTGKGSTVATLSEDRATLTFADKGAWPGRTANRRPWDTRCKAGETFFAGMCYDVPYNYEMTTPGFMGTPCPALWRDDGTQCWPPWTGVKVAAQADPDGEPNWMRPILVTDCSNYSQQKGQKCPTNFKNTGGPLGCTCEAQPTSKNVKTILGSMPK
jgi:hypothetical protein